MELEKEPRKPLPSEPPKTSTTPKSYSSRSTEVLIPTSKNYSREFCVVIGTLLLAVGLIGFVMDNFLGAHLTYSRNAIHVATGALALWFGFDSLKSARGFSLVAGVLYGAVGIAGFVLGKEGTASIGSAIPDQKLWQPLPQVLEMGTADHIINLAIGGALIIGALVTFKIKRRLNYN